MICLCLKSGPTLDRSCPPSPQYMHVPGHDSGRSSGSEFEFRPSSHFFTSSAEEDDLESMSYKPAMWSPMNADGYEIKSLKENRTLHVNQESELIHVVPDSPPYIRPLSSSNSDEICDDSLHRRRFAGNELHTLSHCSSLRISESKKFISRQFRKSRKGGESTQDLQPSPFSESSTETSNRCDMQFRIQVLSPSYPSKETRPETTKGILKFRIHKGSTTSSPVELDSHTQPGATLSKTGSTPTKDPIVDQENINMNRKLQTMVRQGTGLMPRARVCGSNLMPQKSLVSNRVDDPKRKKKRAGPRATTEQGGVMCEGGCGRSEGGKAGGSRKGETLQYYYRLHYGRSQSVGSPEEVARSRTWLPYRQYLLG